jgi:hypothetical protein
MSERTVYVDGVMLTEAQVREAVRKLDDMDIVYDRVQFTNFDDDIYLSLPVEALRDALDSHTDADGLIQWRVGSVDDISSYEREATERPATRDEVIAAIEEMFA